MMGCGLLRVTLRRLDLATRSITSASHRRSAGDEPGETRRLLAVANDLKVACCSVSVMAGPACRRGVG